MSPSRFIWGLLRSPWYKVRAALKDFLYGFFLFGMVEEVKARRRLQEDLFMLLLAGDLLGVPVSGGVYRLRLLKFYAGQLEHWRRRTCSSKDLFDAIKEC